VNRIRKANSLAESCSSRISKNHVEKLEEKLDGLVMLLKSGNKENATGNGMPPLTPSNPVPHSVDVESLLEGIQPSGPNLHDPEEAENWDERLHCRVPVHKRLDLPQEFFLQDQDNQPSHSTCNIDLGEEDPCRLLFIFRTEMRPTFPFIAIPENSFAEDVRRDTPTLYIAIMAVSSRNSARRKTLANLVLRELSEKIFINGERSMDLLLAVLTYATW